MLAGWLNSFRLTNSHNLGNNVYSRIFIQTRGYAARKGTREKARKKKIKQAIEKVGFVATDKRKVEKPKVTISPLTLINESWKQKAIDDVWVMKYHLQPIYSLKETIEFHRETHHPTMFNEPNACVNAFIELNMKHEKKNKFVDKFTRIVDVPHSFEYPGNKFTVLALCKNAMEQENAKNAGADFVGGIEIVKQIQVGKFEFKEYDYILAHVDILAELLLIRGLLRKKFPSTKLGTLGNNMHTLVSKFKNAIRYTAIPDKDHKEYGQIDVIFGTLDMDMTQLEENFAAVITNLQEVKREGSFIERVQIRSAPSNESLKINIDEYLPAKDENKDEEQESENSAVIETH